MTTKNESTHAVEVTPDGRIFVHGLEIREEAIPILSYLLQYPDDAIQRYHDIAKGIANIAVHKCHLEETEQDYALEIPAAFMFACKKLMDLLKIYSEKGGEE